MKEEQLKNLLRELTVEEKVGQLVQWNAAGLVNTGAEITGPETAGVPISRYMGSVLNFGSPAEARTLQEKYLAQDPHHIPLLFMMDVIHGYKTIFPIPLMLAGSFDPALARECSEMAAKEARAGGIHVTFTPMVDYVRDPRWGRVMESGGEDPFLAGCMGAAQVRGFQGDGPELKENGLAACVKHFAAYGGAEGGRDYNQTELSEHILRDLYLPAYKACLDAGARLLMPSFNNLNGLPSVANPWLIQQVLRREWGFDGVVISDYNAIGELLFHGVAEDMESAAVASFRNSCDMDMVAGAYSGYLAQAVQEGKVSEEDLDVAVMRLLKLKNELGLFEDPFLGLDEEKEKSLCLSPAHRALARHAATESAVLLKNQDRLLPLSKKLRRLALVGPFAAEKDLYGAWACHGKAEDTVSVEEAIREMLPGTELLVETGCTVEGPDAGEEAFLRAVDAAKQADAVILCLGEPMGWSGEGHSRGDLSLPGRQTELAQAVVQVNASAVAVLFNGRPLLLEPLDRVVPAILEMGFPGSEAGHATADLLFGDCEPGGRLAMTFPRSMGQIPIYYNHSNTGRPKQVPDHEFQPYASNYLDIPNAPLYPFGWGMGYSEVCYESLTLDRDRMTREDSLTATVTLKNAGSRETAEVVQLYLHDRVSSAVTPVQKLIAFEKVRLAPGETKKVAFRITEPMLRFLDFSCRMISEPGDFDLFVGCADHPRCGCSFSLTD